MGFDADLDVFLALLSGEADLAINKTGEALNPVEDGLNVELDGWPPWLNLDNRLETRSDDRKPAIFFAPQGDSWRQGIRRSGQEKGSGLPSGPNTPPTTSTHPPIVPALRTSGPPEIPWGALVRTIIKDQRVGCETGEAPLHAG